MAETAEGGFNVTNSADGRRILKYDYNIKQNLDGLSAQLSAHLKQHEGINVINFSEVPVEEFKFEQLMPILTKYVLRSPKKNVIIVADRLVHKVRGKIIEDVIKDIKSLVGSDNITLGSLQTSVKIREIFDVNLFARAIISQADVTVEKKNHIKSLVDEVESLKHHEIPSAQYGAILKSCKNLIHKVKGMGKKRANQHSKKPILNDSTEEQEEFIDIEAESDGQSNDNEADGKAKEHSGGQSNDNEADGKAKKHSGRFRKCYVCRSCYSTPRRKEKLDEVWKTYPRLCRSCAEENFEKRSQKTDLTGKYAVVTGGRIKIGYELVLKMLRDGCAVITTSRFPHDTAKRFAAEKDSDEWKARLYVYALDLKDIPGTYKFIEYVKSTFPHLDILINNAAQTIRRPMDFYRHLMDYECIPRDHIPEEQQKLLVDQEALNYGYYKQALPTAPTSETPTLPTVVELEDTEESLPVRKRRKSSECSIEESDFKTNTSDGTCKKRTETHDIIEVDSSDDICLSDDDNRCNGALNNDRDCKSPKTVTLIETKRTKQSPLKGNNQQGCGVDKLSFENEAKDVKDIQASTTVVNITASLSLLNTENETLSKQTIQNETVLQSSSSNVSQLKESNDTVTKQCQENTGDNTELQPASKYETVVLPSCSQKPSSPLSTSVPPVSHTSSPMKQPNIDVPMIDVPLSRSVSVDGYEANRKRYRARKRKNQGFDMKETTPVMTSSRVSGHLINTGSAFSSMARYFPRGATDADGQQLDLRRKNSWRMLLEDVPVTEVVEIFVVNVIAPFLLNKELKGFMRKSPTERKFIVNVSAMEGQFNRTGKTRFHPHTNMGKAALNMMTRTAAIGYKDDGIYMTSVDTGWVTDERPFHMAKHEVRVKGFTLPLDSVDGAARIYDPIVVGLTDTETEPHYAVFLKNYAVYPW